MCLLIWLFGLSPASLRAVAEGTTPQCQATSCTYYGPGWRGKQTSVPLQAPEMAQHGFRTPETVPGRLPQEHLAGRGNCHVTGMWFIAMLTHVYGAPSGDPIWFFLNMKVKTYHLLNSTESHLGLSHLEDITQAQSPHHILIVSG